MLKLKNVSKYYYQAGVIAEGFSKVNLELHLGEFVVITGESGSGKSTLLNVLSGLDSYEDGEMYINGEETSHYTEEDYLNYRRRYVSNIFQNFNLVNSYTVYQNIELAMLMNGKKKREIKKYVNELIEKVGLKKYRNTKASKLSGGQKQRVAIARALANDTPIIVADEPTGALDSEAAKNILKILHDISKNKLVIIVTHQKEDVEKYATRLIKMHDGKILENKLVEKINLDKDLVPKEVDSIKLGSKLRLGIRNAFNIPIKFILMFVIFMLITVTLITNYASLKMAENEELGNAYNNFFNDTDNRRIILTKKDKTSFTEEDYNNINNLDNILFLTKYDLLNDIELFLESDNLYLNGNIKINTYKNVDVGNIPLNDNEVIVKWSKENWYLSNNLDTILQNEFILESDLRMSIKIVGVIYDDSFTDYDLEFYVSENLSNKLLKEEIRNKSDVIFKLDNNYVYSSYGSPVTILESDKLSNGEIYISDDLSGYCENYNCLNKEVNLKIKNIFYEDELNSKIVKVLTKENALKLVNRKYEELYNTIYISSEEYNKLFLKDSYQSSVYVKEIKDLNKTGEELKNLDLEILKIKDAKHNDAEMVTQIFKIFKLILIVILVVVLFFISYFIMKIIYKSRNSYYTTLRTLGGTKRVCVSILMYELINLSMFTYLIFLLFINLIKYQIIHNEYFNELIKYISIREYVIVYIILLLLSILMAYRYGRKIFKKSIIKTYGERI